MRRAEVRTELDDAGAVAAAIRPDNTEEMKTRAEEGAVVTTVERETTGGLRSTVDDYVVNLDVAVRTIGHAARKAPGGPDPTHPADSETSRSAPADDRTDPP